MGQGREGGRAAGAGRREEGRRSPGLLRAAGSGLGVVGSLAAYALLQERLVARPWGGGGPGGPEAEYFQASLLAVLANRAAASGAAFLALAARPPPARRAGAPRAPLRHFAAISAANVAATACQYEALKHVSFPVQALAKAGKVLPAMAWGWLVLRKRYPLYPDVAAAAGVSAGALLFLLSADSLASGRRRGDGTGGGAGAPLVGAALMAAYLLCDGLTSTLQQRLFEKYRTPTQAQVAYTSLCSAGVALGSLLLSGQLLPSVAFVVRHRRDGCLAALLQLATAATVGQFFIAHTIKEFGAVFYAGVMATRQLLSIVLSSVVFLHPLNAGQALGLALVAAGLAAKVHGRGAGGGDVRRGKRGGGRGRGGEASDAGVGRRR